MPYTVGLVLAGMGLSFLQLRLQLHLSKDLIFSVFLPPLVFQAALCINWQKFKKDLPVVALLATAGVLLAAAVTAVGMHYALDWDWGSSIVFGVLIAATDPVSVTATFKEAGVQGRLRLLVETESLLNDGTAAVAFVAVLNVLAGEHNDVASITSTLLFTIGGGTLIGALVGFASVLLAGRTTDHLVEITLTALAAYGSFIVAEHYHYSGVLAALTAGLVVGNFRSAAMISDKGRHTLETFWEFAAFIVNSLIFLLIGAQEVEQHFSGLWFAVLVA
ncbi:MAG TPA: sodium:proton antiporter, partial [Steroidobacteraceae bacterium]